MKKDKQVRDFAILKEIREEYEKKLPNYRWDVYKLLCHPFLKTKKS